MSKRERREETKHLHLPHPKTRYRVLYLREGSWRGTLMFFTDKQKAVKAQREMQAKGLYGTVFETIPAGKEPTHYAQSQVW